MIILRNIKKSLKDLFAYFISGLLSKRMVSMLCHEPYFRVWEKKGIHITPVHFYQPIPDTRTLEESNWFSKSKLVGIEMNEEGQKRILTQFTASYQKEYQELSLFKTSAAHEFYIDNGTFESVDAEVLYCMIRHFKPKKVIEIGSGNSTYLSAHAVMKNKNDTGADDQFIAIEPFPNGNIKNGIPGLTQLIEQRLEQIDPGLFSDLQENDLLFIDSSHVLKIGSDVQKFYLDILPRLRKGVLIHIHDIFLPAEYPKEVIMKRLRFWTEQYLLQAFLAFNESYNVLWASSYMHLNHPDLLEKAFPSYNRDTRWPGSFWIQKTK